MLNNFSFLLEGELAGCGHPDTFGDCTNALTELHHEGIKAIVSVDEEGLPLHMLAEHGFQYLHLGIADFQPPTLQQAEEFIAFVEKQKGEGNAVMVHCRGGYGRTGTMLASYLISKGQTAANAIAEVREKRPGSIETRGQERFLHEFENYLRATTPHLDRRRARRARKSA